MGGDGRLPGRRGSRANLRRVWAPRPTDVIHVSADGAAYMPPASLCGMPFAGCCFSFNIGLAIRLKMYPRCRAWTFDNRLHPSLFSVQLHLCF